MSMGNLVTLLPGRYLRSGVTKNDVSPFIKVEDEINAMLVDYQGKSPDKKLDCWSVLVHDVLLLAWQDQFRALEKDDNL